MTVEFGEREVVIPGGRGIILHGTIAMPEQATPSRFPALLLIQGSGPTDRNGNQGEHIRTDLLRQFAHLLATNGIASLRYDKRGMYANSASIPEDVGLLDEFFSWRNFVEVDGGRCGILGHSEGGSIGLEITHMEGAANYQPKALVLAATSGRPVGILLEEQLGLILSRQNLSAEKIEFYLAAFREVASDIQSSGEIPKNIPDELKPIFPPGTGHYYRSLLALDPIPLAARYAGPVLVINGRPQPVDATL